MSERKITFRPGTGRGDYIVVVDGKGIGRVHKREQRIQLAGSRGRGTLLVSWWASAWSSYGAKVTAPTRAEAAELLVEAVS